MPSTIKHINGIGDVLFSQTARSKRTTIRISDNGEVRVSMPASYKLSAAEKFVYEKQEWILETLKKIQSKQKATEKLFTPSTDFTTYARRLKIYELSPNIKITGQITRDEIHIDCPAGFDYSDKNFQVFVKKMILKALTSEAKLFLPNRAKYLADKFGFTLNRVTVRDVRSRWGSCSSEKNISLNIHLMRLPEHLRDYIILHELCHTKHLNHSSKFWDLLNDVSQKKSDVYKTELKKFNPQVF